MELITSDGHFFNEQPGGTSCNISSTQDPSAGELVFARFGGNGPPWKHSFGTLGVGAEPTSPLRDWLGFCVMAVELAPCACFNLSNAAVRAEASAKQRCN